jgi:hypothetical protein
LRDSVAADVLERARHTVETAYLCAVRAAVFSAGMKQQRNSGTGGRRSEGRESWAVRAAAAMLAA